MESLKWEALLFYLFYLFGKRSGMKMFKRFLTAHFPYLADENEDWRRWATNQIELLGGRKWQPTKLYGRTKQLKRLDQKSSTTLSNLSQVVTDQGGRYQMAKKKKVLVDPGHGGHDSGAISITGVKEKDINLATALMVKELLKGHPDIEVILTRETDMFISLSERANMANKMKVDAFISIHVNSYKSDSSGSETEYTRDGDSVKLANILQKNLVQATGFRNRGINKLNLAVTRETKMAAALTEPGYLSNPSEEPILISTSFISKYADAVARSACEFFGVEFVSKPATPENTFPAEIVIGENSYAGLIIDGRSWVPARNVLAALGIKTWLFDNKAIVINGNTLETKIYKNTSYIKSVDLQYFGLVKSVFLEPDAINTKRVLIFPKEEFS